MRSALLILIALSGLFINVHAQKLVQNYKITYDEQLRPVIIIDLNNKLSKKVTHIVYKFLMADMSGWENTSTARALEAQSTTRITRVVNLPSGYKLRDSFIVPQLNRGATDAPTKIGIDYIRFSDGTIDKTISR